MKQQLTAQSQQDELRKCGQILARLSPEESSLLTRVSNLKDDLKRLSHERAVHHPLEFRDGGQPGRVIERMAAIEVELPRLEARLREIVPLVKKAQAITQASRSELLAESRKAAQTAFDDAMSKASPARSEFLAAKEKLGLLQSKLSAAKEEVRRLEKNPFSTPNQTRAAILLETGEIPPAQTAPQSSEELREARAKVSVIKAAIGMQTTLVDTAKSVFSGEVYASLKPYREDIIMRIAAGYSAAANAALEAELLMGFTGSAELLMSYFSCPAVQPALQEGAVVFESWLADSRRAGYDV